MTLPPPTGHVTAPDGTRLAYRDAQGPGQSPPLLLLHGLAGHMGEWDDLAARLQADGHRVMTYDARGHGASTRRPRDMTRASFVADARAMIEHLSLTPALSQSPSPVTLVGQSLGGHTALLTAAAHPHLVHTLVLIEAGPSGANPNLPTEIGTWLDSWPRPFKSLAAAEKFFGHEAWARGLEQRPDGWHARVDRDQMVAAVAELAERSYWDEWERVRCPTLVLRGEKGTMPASETAAMAERAKMRPRRPAATETEVVQDAGHDVHLDQPGRLYEAVRAFLARRSTAAR